MKDLRNKVAAITGAGSGIGRALALKLADEGCHLALADVDEAGLKETRQLLEARAVRVTTHSVDVSDRAAVYQWADDVVAGHGGVNLIINNAGVGYSSTIAAMDQSSLERIININLWGVIHGTKAFLPYVEASGEGHVVNLSSVHGLFSQPGIGAYSITKFAVRGFTEALCQELSMQNSCVSATCVHPGGVKTNIINNGESSESLEDLFGQEIDVLEERFERLFQTTPEKAAAVIVNAIKRKRRRVLVGSDAKLIDTLVRLFPVFHQRLSEAMVKFALKKSPPAWLVRR